MATTQTGSANVESGLPAYLEPYYSGVGTPGETGYQAGLLPMAYNEANQVYTPYTEPRLAQRGPEYLASQNMITGMPATPDAYGTAMDAVQDNAGAAAGLAGMPGYTFSAYDGFAPSSATAYGGYNAYNPTAYSGFDASNFNRFNGYNSAGNLASQYDFGDTQRFGNEQADQYMSPYIQEVLDVQTREAEKDYLRSMGRRNSEAVQAGAFGGSRAYVREGLAEDEMMDRQSQIRAEGLQAAYNAATGQFNADENRILSRQGAQAGEQGRVQGLEISEAGRVQGLKGADFRQVQDAQAAERARVQAANAAEASRVQDLEASEAARIQNAKAAERARVQGISIDEAARIQAGEAGEVARVQGAQAAENIARDQFALEALGVSSDMSDRLMNMGERERATFIQTAQLLEAIGKDNFAYDQVGLDLAYGDYLRQLGFSAEKIAEFAAILNGTPFSPDQKTTQYIQTNPLQELVGLGLQGVGAYNAYRAGNNP